jgi:hypothetical protein
MTNHTQTGYGDVGEEEEEKLPEPWDRKWSIEHVEIGTSGEALYANVALDGEVIGAIRFPSQHYLAWFRNQVVGEVASDE